MAKVYKIGIATERDIALPIQATKTVRVAFVGERELAAPIEVELTASQFLTPRQLTGNEHGLITLLAALAAHYAAMHDASPELTLFLGLVVYLTLREATRRFLSEG